jgi:hypothetical protein
MAVSRDSGRAVGGIALRVVLKASGGLFSARKNWRTFQRDPGGGSAGG